MRNRPDLLEELFALPAAEVPPHTPAEELQAASLILRTRRGYVASALFWWLRDTATIHSPTADGLDCERDGDGWPCLDMRAARKVAEAINCGLYDPTP